RDDRRSACLSIATARYAAIGSLHEARPDGEDMRRFERTQPASVPIARSCRPVKRLDHVRSPYRCTVNGDPPPVLLPPCGTGSSGVPNGTPANVSEIALIASAAAAISLSEGTRYSLPEGPSTTTAVSTVPIRPATASARRSPLSIATVPGRPQQGHQAPER